jgi:hypothetical protein
MAVLEDAWDKCQKKVIILDPDEASAACVFKRKPIVSGWE